MVVGHATLVVDFSFTLQKYFYLVELKSQLSGLALNALTYDWRCRVREMG